MSKINIIAELAQGYEGKVFLAKQLIESAKLAGADYAKIQVVFADELATRDYKDYKIFKSLELNKKKWREIYNFAEKKKISLITEVFGKKSVDVCRSFKSKYYKIHPTDINNFELLNIIKLAKPKKIFLGVGGATQKEIEDSLIFLKDQNIILLHGHQSLPTPNKDINLKRISNILKNNYFQNRNMHIGIADHVDPKDNDHNLIVAMAIGAGATYVEKHLTTNRVYKLEDYHSALNPDEFKNFVDKINFMKIILGDGKFLNNSSEKNYRNLVRRSYFLKKKIKKNSILKYSNVVMKRSSKISNLTNIKNIIGKRAKKVLKKNELIQKKHFS